MRSSRVSLTGVLAGVLAVAALALPPGLTGRAAAATPAATLAGAPAAGGTAGLAASGCPWMDPTLPAEQRARMVLARMTLDEKIGMVHGSEPTGYTYFGAAGHVAGIPRLCVPDLVLNDAGSGVGNQKVGVTAFPVGIAQAATWDPALQQQFGRALGQEAFGKGINVQLAPGVNIARVPMNGRNFEYAGEDPYLAGTTASAIIRGIQTNPVVATVKHFALNNQETDRMTVSADAAERTMQEIYLPAFEAAVRDGGVGAVMCSYNKINGIYGCEQPTLLTSVLKRQFGFTGWVMTDWEAMHSTVPAALAGTDMEMAAYTNGKYYGTPLKDAVESGQVPMSRLDDMVLRILRTMFRLGLFDHRPVDGATGYAAQVDTPAHIALAREIAAEGTVLLKNAGGILPLTTPRQRLAVIGTAAGAGAMQTYTGSGSSRVQSLKVVSPLAGIQRRAAALSDTVVYADGTVRADAVVAAKAADVAVVVVNDTETEGKDRATLSLNQGACAVMGCTDLPVDQDALIAAVAAANPNTIVVINSGGPVTMPWLGQVRAVLEAWYPGQENGNALASVLFGDVNPSGKLPQTFPRAERDLPTRTAAQWPGVNGHAVYSEGLLVGYRWFDAERIAPLFPFGYGLSYTTFGYGPVTVRRTPTGATVTFTVTNTGRRAGAEVAQVYVGQPAAAGEPPRALQGFRKVFLAPGERVTVTVPLTLRAFAHWDDASHGWAIAAGRYTIAVGSSSRDLRGSGTISLPARQLD